MRGSGQTPDIIFLLISYFASGILYTTNGEMFCLGTLSRSRFSYLALLAGLILFFPNPRFYHACILKIKTSDLTAKNKGVKRVEIIIVSASGVKLKAIGENHPVLPDLRRLIIEPSYLANWPE